MYSNLIQEMYSLFSCFMTVELTGFLCIVQYVRSHPTAFPSNAKANGTTKAASFSPMMARGDWDENGSNQLKRSSSGEVASTHTAPLVAQDGYGFSLPWYR